jgi:hypothetical protein
MISKSGQMKALSKPFDARMAGGDESFESDHGWPKDDPASSSVAGLGSPFASPMQPSRDEGAPAGLGRIGKPKGPQPPIDSKPYGSADGQAPNQDKSRSERSAGAIADTRLARPQHPGGSGLMAKPSGSAVKPTGPVRPERAAGLGARGRPVPQGESSGAGVGPKGGR